MPSSSHWTASLLFLVTQRSVLTSCFAIWWLIWHQPCPIYCVSSSNPFIKPPDVDSYFPSNVISIHTLRVNIPKHFTSQNVGSKQRVNHWCSFQKDVEWEPGCLSSGHGPGTSFALWCLLSTVLVSSTTQWVVPLCIYTLWLYLSRYNLPTRFRPNLHWPWLCISSQL